MSSTLARPAGRRVELVASTIGYLGVAIGITWPLAAGLGDRYAGNRPLDIWVHAWNLWWLRQALTVLMTNPFVTHHLFFPDGIDLYLHILSPLAGLLALPIGLLWGPVAAYNVTVLAGLTLAGLATYWLTRRWAPPLAAALAGLAFLASPWVMHQLRVGHLNLMNAGWLPLAILAILRATDSHRTRDRLAGVLALVAAALIDWQHAVFLAVAGLIVAIERLVTAGAWATARARLIDLLLMAGGAGLVVSPLLVASLRQGEVVAPSFLAKLEAERVQYSADLLAYLMPQLLHPLWGQSLTAWLIEHPLGAPSEGRVGLGLTVLALGGIAFLLRQPGRWLWLAIGLVGLSLSLGPRLQIAGIDSGLPGPYSLIDELPLLRFGRTPARFAVLPALAAAILAGLGLAALLARLERRSRVGASEGGANRPRRGPLMAVGLIGLLLFEYLPVPYPTTALPSLALAEQVRRLAGERAVLELPYHADVAPRMLYQMVHGRPIFGGYVTRPPERRLLDQTPVLANLMRPIDQPDIITVDDPLALLATYKIGVIVVYRPPYYSPDTPQPPPTETLLRRRVHQLLGVTAPTWEDATGAVYQVPVSPAAPVVTLLDGWHATEATPTGWLRWTTERAELRLDRPLPEPLALRFTAYSFQQPRTVTLLLDGQPLTSLIIDTQPRPYLVRLPAGSGPTQLTLSVAEGAVAPLTVGAGNDPRRLALAISGMSATSTPNSAS